MMNKEKFVVLLGFITTAILVIISLYSLTLLVLIIAGIVGLVVYGLFLNKKLNLYHFTLILIPAFVFSPSITIASGLPDIRFDDLWLGFGTIVFLTKLSLAKLKLRVKFSLSAKIFLLFITWIAITILISSFREPYYYKQSDWFELVKNGKLLVIFLIVYNLKITNNQFYRLVNMLIFSLFISAVFGVFQFFNILNVNSWLTPYFIADSQVAGFERNGRVVGTFANPNVFAGVLLVGVSLSLSKLLNKLNIFSAIHLLFFILAIFLTLSRTGLIALAVVGCSVVLVSLVRSRNKISILLFSGISSFVPLLALKFVPESFFYRMGFLNDISSDGSFSARRYNWEQIIESRTKINILTGTGPTGKLPITFDNEWLHILTYYGIIGATLFVLLFLVFFINVSNVKMKENSWIQISCQCLLITFPIYMVTSVVFQQLQIMPIVMMCLSLGFYAKRLKKDETDEALTSENKQRKKRFKRYRIVW